MREPEPKTKQAPPGVLLETTLKTRNQNRIRVLGSLYYNVVQINWSIYVFRKSVSGMKHHSDENITFGCTYTVALTLCGLTPSDLWVA